MKKYDERRDISLNVHPNPFQDFLNVEYQSIVEGQGEIRIYNNQGKAIHTKEVYCDGDKQNQRIDFKSFDANGLYFIQFITPDSKTKTSKAILLKND